jgi:hypothetical protein
MMEQGVSDGTLTCQSFAVAKDPPRAAAPQGEPLQIQDVKEERRPRVLDKIDHAIRTSPPGTDGGVSRLSIVEYLKSELGIDVTQLKYPLFKLIPIISDFGLDAGSKERIFDGLTALLVD